MANLTSPKSALCEWFEGILGEAVIKALNEWIVAIWPL
jgi:hypothetical protein